MLGRVGYAETRASRQFLDRPFSLADMFEQFETMLVAKGAG
jgi:hypothetical protein